MTYEAQKVTLEVLLNTWNEANNHTTAMRDAMEAAKRAFVADADRVDAALEGERENLRGEIDELSATIRRLSGQLAAGVAGTDKIDRDMKENLRRLIADARARRDEAEATLDGLGEVLPEYSKELFDAAAAAKDDFFTAVDEENATINSLRDCLDEMDRKISGIKDTLSYGRTATYGVNERFLSDVASRFNHAAG